MPVPASATSVGSGKTASRSGPSPRASGGAPNGARQRRSGGTASAAPRRTATTAGGGTGAGGMWRFYTEDSPGIKVGPVPVLVMGLLFIASVFMLHLWGKFTRSA